ncbi:MAG: hypothetical protein H7X93_05375 [Sphingomonadaceae bacterium]|nr:hypothetical protein [Sphingomonadaceae bacterium]
MATRPAFSPSAAWDEVNATLRAELRLLVAIAGAFFLLPAVLVDYIVPDPEGLTSFAQLVEAVRPHLHWFLLLSLVQYIGQLAILALILSPERLTVGGAIGRGFQLLPFYFLLSICTNVLTGLGLLLLIVPGLWLIARLSATGPVLVAEGARWPFPVIARGFALTKGNALPIFAFLFIVAMIYLLISVVVSLVFGAALGMAGLGMTEREAGATILSILGGIVSAAGATIFTLMSIAIYRQLGGEPRAARVFS